jgi:hypothetical protein
MACLLATVAGKSTLAAYRRWREVRDWKDAGKAIVVAIIAGCLLAIVVWGIWVHR